LLDPLGGSEDLAQGILRATSASSFSADPVRTLRAVRMQTQFGCRVEPQTREWLREAVPRLRSVSAERIRDEWFRILQQPRASTALHELQGLGLLFLIAPPLAPLQDLVVLRANALTHALETVHAVELLWDAFAERADARLDLPQGLRSLGPHIRQRYSLPVCDERTRLALCKCAALLHDVGKPAARRVGPDGRALFPGHEQIGAKIASALAREWRLSNAEGALLRAAIKAHTRPALLAREPTLSRRAIYRFYRDAGSAKAGVDAAFVALADYLAAQGPERLGEGWERQAQIVARLWAAHFEQHGTTVAPRRLLSGADLVELGVRPGPELGHLLERIREAQAAGEVETRQQALAIARDWLSKEGS
jgi:putative nucleotidyltransferase with HDIG domain